MANRAYLFAVDSIPQNHSDARKCIGISEFNYDIPDIYRLLVSANPVTTTSIIWDHPEPLAIVGEAAAGKARLESIRQKLPEGDPARSAVDQWLDFLNRPWVADYPYFILEAGELFDMTDIPFKEQLGTLTTEINQLSDQALSTSVSGETLIKRWAPDTQTHFLYFEPRGTARPDFAPETTSFRTTPAEFLEKLDGLKAASHISSVSISCTGDVPLADALKKLGDVSHVKNLAVRNLDESSLPDALGDLVHIENLSISNLGLETLPASIAGMRSLKNLYANKNRFSELPNTLSKLSTLENINFDLNKLTALPEWLIQLQSLKKVSFNSNPITTLPDWLFDLARLEELSLGGCGFSKLPAGIEKLTQLNSLNLAGNPLRKLPDSLGKLKSLQEIKILGCQLTELPKSLGKLPNLQHVYVSDNPLKSIPISLRRAPLKTLHLMDTPIKQGMIKFGAERTIIGPKGQAQHILRGDS